MLSTPTEKQTKRVLYLDLLTILCCFAVITLHCNSYVYSNNFDVVWVRSLVAEVLFFFAVPCFFMMTGANNMEYRRKYTTGQFLKRRLKKLLLPFVAWSLFVYLYHNGQSASPLGFLQAFMANEILSIYWFFPAIISLTLAMPVLSLLAEHEEGVRYLCIVSFIFIAVIPPVCKMLQIPWSEAFTLPVATYVVMYAMLGYYLSRHNLQKRTRIIIYLAALFSLALRFFFTYFNSTAAGTLDNTLFSYAYFTGVLPAMAVFLLFKNHNWENSFFARHTNAVVSVSSCAFGIYLLHMLLLQDVVLSADVLGWSAASLRVQIACPFLIFLASLAIIFIMKKVPVLKELVP